VPQPARLETERLVLQGWSAPAREALAALNADPLVMEFFPAVQSRAETDELVDRIEAGFAEHGFGLWAVQRRDTGEFVGFTGLITRPDGTALAGEVEVGWRLARSAWGSGFASEAARAALAYGFDVAELPTVMSTTARTNVRSWRVMERLGMLRDRAADFDHPALPRGIHCAAMSSTESPLRVALSRRSRRAPGSAGRAHDLPPVGRGPGAGRGGGE
jgi:ribosomal-protein-alanine N-acetyltransferase